MALKCGIVGLPNVGKSTLFNCLSNAKAQSANFPFCTIEPNLGTISVPDNRLNELEKLVNPERVLPTTIEIVDIAGLVKGASKGEGLGNKFLANIRETDAIIHVLRCFDDDNIIHVDGSVDPVRDKEIIDIELQLKDLEAVEGKIKSLGKAAASGGREVELEAEEDVKFLKDLHLLTTKPVMYLCNVDEGSVADGNKYVEQVREAVKAENAEVLFLGAAIEADINELESFEDRQEFLGDMGLKEPGVNKLITSAYKLLNLSTYFTAGVKEVRAWTITKGMTAPQAAGVIHTDFEKGFIRAEVIKYKDFIEFESEAKVKDAGKLGVEGKEYIVEDGDVMHFRFNV